MASGVDDAWDSYEYPDLLRFGMLASLPLMVGALLWVGLSSSLSATRPAGLILIVVAVGGAVVGMKFWLSPYRFETTRHTLRVYWRKRPPLEIAKGSVKWEPRGVLQYALVGAERLSIGPDQTVLVWRELEQFEHFEGQFARLQ